MALPIAGAWVAANANANQYAGALKWGTGNNPVHSVYGAGPPIGVTGRIPGPDMPGDQPSDIPESFENPDQYGYCMEDIATSGYWGMPPEWGTDVSVLRSSSSLGTQGGPPDWDVTSADPEMTRFRNTPEQDPRLWSTDMKSWPTETVSEGWLNKATGQVNDAEISDPAQYERQTSMQQVNPAAGRNNNSAVARGTDEPRFDILTRLTGMKIKPWSQGQRNEDMFPFQQETMVRPFWYRTGGTGYPEDMLPNEMYVSDPIQRDVPPDPYLGETEIAGNVADQYGYTTEDVQYA
jgi:hypothetical protein